MSDDHVDDADQGDAPDTIDDRLAAVARLVDTLRDELDAGRRARHRAVAVRLLARLLTDLLARVAAELDELDQVDDQ